MRIAFLGTPRFALPILEASAQASELVLVVAQPDKPVGATRSWQAPPAKRWAVQRGIRVEQPELLTWRNPEVALLARGAAYAA